MPTNQTWYLRKRPTGNVAEGDLELVSASLGNIPESFVRVRTIYLSLGPTNRI